MNFFFSDLWRYARAHVRTCVNIIIWSLRFCCYLLLASSNLVSHCSSVNLFPSKILTFAFQILTNVQAMKSGKIYLRQGMGLGLISNISIKQRQTRQLDTCYLTNILLNKPLTTSTHRNYSILIEIWTLIR